MTPKLSSQSQKWASYTIFFLLTSFSTEGAASPSVWSLTSASASTTANQRPARSAEGLDPLSQDNEEDMDVDDYSAEFLETLLHILSEPVDKNREDVLAIVLKLLSENDHKTSLPEEDADWSFTTSRDVLPEHLLYPKRDFQGEKLDPDSFKRGLPKFNPTGWRRKRSTFAKRYDFQRYLRRFLRRMKETHVPEVTEKLDNDVVPEFAEWKEKKRESLRRVLDRLPKELTPKRRPLDFNPTGW